MTDRSRFGFGAFFTIYNDAVTVAKMVAHRAMFAAAAARDRHVLAIQDTSEINYQSQSGRKQRLGTVGNGSDVGLFVHPVLAIDAANGECLGLVDAQVWRRTTAKAKNYKQLPIEEQGVPSLAAGRRTGESGAVRGFHGHDRG